MICRIAALLSICLAQPLAAQDKMLHWRQIAVKAHLDADGRLHVIAVRHQEIPYELEYTLLDKWGKVT